ncbi:MAG TPA: hypothetical protein VGM19_05405 [Armatimonadota bacterium]|jgi:hypothetical protein
MSASRKNPKVVLAFRVVRVALLLALSVVALCWGALKGLHDFGLPPFDWPTHLNAAEMSQRFGVAAPLPGELAGANYHPAGMGSSSIAKLRMPVSELKPWLAKSGLAPKADQKVLEWRWLPIRKPPKWWNPPMPRHYLGQVRASTSVDYITDRTLKVLIDLDEPGTAVIYMQVWHP